MKYFYILLILLLFSCAEEGDRKSEEPKNFSAFFFGKSEYKNAKFVAAHPNNYDKGRAGNKIDMVVVHTMEGYYQVAIDMFANNGNREASIHYNLRSEDGEITQQVLEEDTAWHAGNYPYNQKSIGLEHEGFMDQPKWFTDVMMDASAELVAHLCEKYDIPVNRKHIIGHVEVPNQSHSDPGPKWPWDDYMDRINSFLEPELPPPDDNSGGTDTQPPETPPVSTGNLFGKVLDQATSAIVTQGKAKLSNSAEGFNAETSLDSEGRFYFYDLKEAEYVVEIVSDGYTGKAITVSVIKGRDNQFNFEINKDSSLSAPPPTGQTPVNNGSNSQNQAISGGLVNPTGQGNEADVGSGCNISKENSEENSLPLLLFISTLFVFIMRRRQISS